jgi:hypothetical protein
MRLETARESSPAQISLAPIFFCVAGLISGLLCWQFVGGSGLAWVTLQPGASLRVPRQPVPRYITPPRQRPNPRRVQPNPRQSQFNQQRVRPNRQRRNQVNPQQRRETNPRDANQVAPETPPAPGGATPKQAALKPLAAIPTTSPAPESRVRHTLAWVNFNRRAPPGVGYTRLFGGAGVLFALAMAVALFVSRVEIDQPFYILLGAFLGMIVLYEIGYRLLFHGYFELLFGFPLWLNCGLCGILGAAMMGLIAGTVLGTQQGALFLALCIVGGISALAAVHPIFLYPWWQTTVGTILGLWVTPAEES